MGLNHPTLEVVFPGRMMNVRDIENLKEKRMNGSLWMLRKMKNTPGKQSHFIEGQTNDKGSIDGDRFQQVAFRLGAYAGRIYDVEFAGKMQSGSGFLEH